MLDTLETWLARWMGRPTKGIAESLRDHERRCQQAGWEGPRWHTPQEIDELRKKAAHVDCEG